MQHTGPMLVPQRAFSLLSSISLSMIARVPRVFFKAFWYSGLSSPPSAWHCSKSSCLNQGISCSLLNWMTSSRDLICAPAVAGYWFKPSLNSYFRTFNSCFENEPICFSSSASTTVAPSFFNTSGRLCTRRQHLHCLPERIFQNQKRELPGTDKSRSKRVLPSNIGICAVIQPKGL